MKIDLTYEPGQKVWSVNKEEIEYKCPVCHGEGITEANVAKKIYTVKCPECNGWKHLWKKVYTVKAVTIVDIDIKIISKTSYVITYQLSNDTYLYETELRIYTSNKAEVFASRKEALAYAKKANKKAKADQEEASKDNAKQDLAEQEAMYGGVKILRSRI